MLIHKLSTLIRVWKDLSLNDSLNEDERAQLAVWDYPIGDKFTKIWAQIEEVKCFKSYSEAIAKIKRTRKRDGHALIGKL